MGGAAYEPESRTLTVTAKRLRPNRLLGLHQTWLDGEGRGVEFSLDSGAGLGNPALSLSIEFPDGRRITEVINVADLATLWLNTVLDEVEQDEQEPEVPEGTPSREEALAQGDCAVCGLPHFRPADQYNHPHTPKEA